MFFAEHFTPWLGVSAKYEYQSYHKHNETKKKINKISNIFLYQEPKTLLLKQEITRKPCSFPYNKLTCEALRNIASVMWCTPAEMAPRATPGNT